MGLLILPLIGVAVLVPTVASNWSLFSELLAYNRWMFLQAGIAFLVVPVMVGAGVWARHRLSTRVQKRDPR